MKRLIATGAVLLSFYGNAQNTTVTYAPSTAIIANPERGFYNHEGTHSNDFDPLNQTSLTNYRVNNKMTLILRLFYLDDFIEGPISSTYLAAMQTDFARIRGAGIKAILRFAYSDDSDNGQMQDATKAQILAHIAQLKPILTANADVIATVQAGFIGTWGEWYYTDHFGMPPNATDLQNRKQIVTAILDALPGKTVQLRTPELKRNCFNVETPLSLTQAYTNTAVARVGHHNDCFLASEDDEGTYDDDELTQEYAYLSQETKYVPMGGETCAVNAPRSLCPTAIDEMEKFHWSYVNLDYHPGVIEDWQDGGCFTEMERRLGYRFQLIEGTYPQTANTNVGAMPITFKVLNEGFATPYNPRTPYIVFRNTANNQEFVSQLNTDPRFWNPEATTVVTDNVPLPSGIVPGNYKLFLKLPDPDPVLATRTEYSIQLANANMWEANTGYNNLNHTVTITSSLGVDDNDIRNELVVYPVPTNNQLILELEGIADYNVLVYNSLGQTIKLPFNVESSSKITMDTQTLSNGVYFVSLDNGARKETKRIIVSH
jgi:hypothetical protein